jgi:hypothetical protein
MLLGQCQNGSQFLYRNGGLSSEIRYFRDGVLVGVVASSDEGVCPSICPFSHFYGSLEDVHCESPSVESLCPDGRAAARVPYLPFADGKPPYGC